jgi:hypothetical protein
VAENVAFLQIGEPQVRRTLLLEPVAGQTPTSR